MLKLLKAQAEEISKLGLTVTQTFYLVARNSAKKFCRFVKTDAIRDAIATLLSIKNKPSLVEDIRLTDAGGLKVWTQGGIKYLARAEVEAFLTNYNHLASNGCSSQCRCAKDPENVWKDICAHRIAEHLVSVREKVSAIAQAAKKVASDAQLAASVSTTIRRRLNEAKFYLEKEKLVGFESEDAGDYFVQVTKYDKTKLGWIIFTAEGQVKILSAVPDSQETSASCVLNAIALLKASVAQEVSSSKRSGFFQSKKAERRAVETYCRQTYGTGALQPRSN